MNKLKYLILLIIPFLLSGCYNYKELDELAITTGLTIDYDNETENFKIYNIVKIKMQSYEIIVNF